MEKEQQMTPVRKRRKRKELGSSRNVGCSVPSTSLNAAALQDHFARTLKLDVQLRTTNKMRSLKSDIWKSKGNKATSRGDPERSRVDGESGDSLDGLMNHKRHTSNNSESSKDWLQGAYDNVWTCERCTFFNEHGQERCHACNSSRRAQQREVTARRDSRTLAQKMGILPGPPPKLTQDGWKELETQSESRGDSYEPCSICRQLFGMEDQLLLSCSHVFHKACLESFERFVRSNERCCPLCRKKDYEKKQVKLGAKAFRQICATRIQSAFRRYSCRLAFYHMLSKHYGSGLGNDALRHKFFATKLTRVSDRLLKSIDAQQDSLDRLFRDLDASLSASRRVFGTCHADDEDRASSALNWLEILHKVQTREGKSCDCPICMCTITLENRQLAPDDSEAPANNRVVTLLSCSHVFHASCIDAFERFTPDKLPQCPMCRETYLAKRMLQ